LFPLYLLVLEMLQAWKFIANYLISSQ
jgi:hypothetical protein